MSCRLWHGLQNGKVKKIKIIGKILIANKNINFLSLNFKFILIFLTNSQDNIKKGIKIPNCFKKKITGNLIWSIKLDCSNPVLANPYVIVINSLLFNQIKCGTKTTKKTSSVIRNLKSNFLSFLKNIK